MSPFDYKELDPGIRQTVRWLRANGFQTTDSGDGRSKALVIADGEALDFPHVFMRVDPKAMLQESHRLLALLKKFNLTGDVELSYNPKDKVAILSLVGTDDNSLTGIPWSHS